MVDVHYHVSACAQAKGEPEALQVPPMPDFDVSKVPLAEGYTLVKRPEGIGISFRYGIGNILYLCLSEG